MAEADLKLTLDLEATGVAAGAAKVEASLEGIAKEAKEAFSKANTEVDKLGKAEGPRELSKQIGRSTVAVIELRDSLSRAQAAGVDIGAKTKTSLAGMEKAIEDANAKSREYADALGDLKTRGDTAAKGMEAVANAAGSVDGILGHLKDTAGPTGQKIADVGFAMGGVAGAFTLGYSTGEKIRELWAGMAGKEMPHLSDKLADLIVKFTTYTTKQKEAASDNNDYFGDPERAAGIERLTKAQEEANKKAEEAIRIANARRTASEAAREGYEKDIKKLEEYGVTVHAAGEATAASTKQLGLWEDIIKKSGKSIKEHDAFVYENREELVKLGDAIDANRGAHIKLDPIMKQAIAQAREMKKADEEAAEKKKLIPDLIRKYKDELNELMVKQHKLAQEVSDADLAESKAYDKKLKKLREAGLSEEEYFAKKKQLSLESSVVFIQNAEKEAKVAEEVARKKLELAKLEGKEDQIKEAQKQWEQAKATLEGFSFALGKAKDNAEKAGDAVEKLAKKTSDSAKQMDAAALASKALGASFNSLAVSTDVAYTAQLPFEAQVRHATKAVQEQSPALKKLIEDMAVLSDKAGDASVYTGSWIAALERGDITLAEFRKRITDLKQGWLEYGAVLATTAPEQAKNIGDMDRIFRELNKTLNDYERKRMDGLTEQQRAWRELQDQIKETDAAAKTMVAGMTGAEEEDRVSEKIGHWVVKMKVLENGILAVTRVWEELQNKIDDKGGSVTLTAGSMGSTSGGTQDVIDSLTNHGGMT